MSTDAFERYTAARLLGQPRFAPDGSGFAYLANTTGIPNIWWQPAGGGFARQLTSFTANRVTNFSWSPDSSRIALLADKDGDELHQLYLLDVPGGWPVRLTNSPHAEFNLAGWTPDGKKIVVTANDREPTEMDPMLIDPSSGEVTRLLTGGQFYAGEVSPDGASLTLVEFMSNDRQRLWLLDLVSLTKRALLGVPVGDDDPARGIKAMPMAWRRDSSGFYATTDEGREFTGLAYVDRSSGAWRYVLEEEAEVEGATMSQDGSLLAAAVNRRAVSELRLFALEGGVEQPLPVPELPLGVLQGLSVDPAGRALLVSLATPSEVSNLSLVYVATGQARRLEQAMLGGLDRSTMISPELIEYPSFDRAIPAWLYRPRGEGPCAMVLSIHGGPEEQERPGYGYLGLYQYLLSKGIGVLAPNIRGSTGYGKSYQRLIHRDWGGGELQDIEAAARYLRALDWVDSARIAIFGGSFGGFATLSALTRLSEYWAAGVDWVGPSNLLTFVGSVPPHWRAMMADWVGDAERDREMLIERSPITHVDSLRAPLLVIQGKNDPRVVQAESDQLVEELRARGVAVEYVIDEEAGHGPPGRDGLRRWLKLTADFLERHLA